MDGITFEISKWYFLIFVGSGIVLFLLFQGLKSLIARFRITQISGFKIERVLPVLEGVIWSVFLITAIQFIFLNHLLKVILILSIVLVVLLLLSWYAVRDLIAGVLLKYQDAFRMDGQIQVKDIEGRVKKIGYMSLEIETFQGEVLTIPYSAIFNEIRTEPHHEEKVKSHTFYMEFPKTHPVVDLSKKIHHSALNAPWSSVVKEPQVKVIEEKEDTYVFEIRVFSLQAPHFQKIKNYLQKNIGSQVLKDGLLSK